MSLLPESFVSTLQSKLRSSPSQVGDDAIKAVLTSLPARNYEMLDLTINELMTTYSLEQIYKVYHQNFD